MTERLYYKDPTLTRFSARVIEHLRWEDRPAVVLERSAFYPNAGGQPHDTGLLCDADSSHCATDTSHCVADTSCCVAVVDVVEREADGAVIHVLSEELEAAEVEAQIDWDRRFDLMQQHTGQHILSAAFLERFEANTVGFHLSDDYSTIDLDRAPLSAEDLSEVETLANSIVFENRPTIARFVPDEEVPTLPLRKPLAHKGPVRIVEIPGFDCSACGGTHVRATGEVGLIKITRSERRGEETRVEFLCGRRALTDYQAKNSLLMGLAREYTVSYREVPDLVHRLAEELKDVRRELRQTRDELLDAEASVLWLEAVTINGAKVVRAHLPGRAPDDLKHLAQRLIVQPKTAVLLAAGEAGQPGFFTFARSADLDVNMGTLVRQACELAGGRGGGRPEFAQGGGPQGERVAQALGEAFRSLEGFIHHGPRDRS